MTKIPKLLFLATSFIVVFWGFVTPIFEFPDEQAHLATVFYVAKHNHVQPWNTADTTIEMYKAQELLGTLRDDFGNNKYTYHPTYRPEYTNTLIGKYEQEIKSLNTKANRDSYIKDEGAQYPIGYYLYSSWWLSLVDKSDLFVRAFFVRLGSVPLVIAMTYFVYKIGLLVFQKRSYATSLVALVFLQPMFTFVTAGVNSDNLYNLLFFAIIYYSLRLIKFGITPRTSFLFLLVLVLDIYTKPQGFIAVPIAAFVFIFNIIKSRHWRLFWGLSLLVVLTSLLVWPQLQQYLSYALIKNTKDVSLVEYLRFSTNKLLAQNIVWYWGVFKWLGVVLPPIYWRVANRVVIFGVVGFFLYLYKLTKKQKLVADPLAVIFLLIISLYYTLAIFWADWQHVKNVGYSLGIQARYFFPTIVAHMALLLVGIASYGWQPKISKIFRMGLLLVFFWLQLGGLWRLITIYYDVNNVQTLITQLSQYKPLYLKGNWWYLLGVGYAISLICLIYSVLVVKAKNSLNEHKD